MSKRDQESIRLLIDSSSDCICHISLDGNFLTMNKAGQKYNALKSEEEAIGNSCTGSVIENREAAEEAIQRAARGHTVSVQYKSANKEGREIWWDSKVTPVLDSDGNIISILRVSRDITEQKYAETALKESEKRYKLLFISNPQPMWVFDVNTLEFLDVNNAAINHYGFSRNEFMSMTIKDIRPKEDIPILIEKVSLSAQGIDHAGEWRHTKKDGTEIVVEIISHPMVFSGKQAKIVLANDITKRKQAEMALISSEEKYRRLVDNALVGVYQSNLEGKLLFVNEALYKMLEFESAEEMTIEGIIVRYVNPEDRKVLIEKLKRLGEVSDFETALYTKSHKIINVLLSASFEGNVISCMISNITERKKAEEGIKLFRTLIDRSNDSIEVVDPENGCFLDVNQTACQALGYSREEYLSLSVFDIDPKVDSNLFAAVMKELRETGTLLWEGIHRRKDGSEFPVEVSLKYIQFGRGYVVAIGRDITERKKVEEALKKSEEKYRNLVDTMNEGLGVQDKNGLITLLNRRALDVLGYELDEVVGKPVTMLFDEANQKILEEQMAHRRRGGNQSYELEWRRKDGVNIPSVISPTPLFDKEGNYNGAVAVFTDISELKHAEEKLLHTISTLQATLESTADGILVVDNNRKITRFNKKFVDMWGIPKKIVDTRDDEKAIAFVLRKMKDPEAFLRKINELYEDPHAESFDVIELNDGKIFERYSTPQKVGDKSIGRVWSFRDITEKQKLATQIVTAKNDWERTFDSIDYPVTIHDKDFNIIRANKATTKTLGKPLKDIVGQKCYKLFHGTDEPIESCAMKQTFKTNKTSQTTIDDHESKKTLLISTSPVKINGKFDNVVHMVRDITYQKITAKKLLETSELERKSISEEIHDGMLQLLYGALIYCRDVEENTDNNKSIKEALKLIEEAMDSGRKLISGIRPSTLDNLGLSYCLNEYMNNLFKDSRAKIRSELQEFKSEFDIILYRVAQELLMNVFKHANAQNVDVSLDNKDYEIVLSVKDDGVGFNFDNEIDKGKIANGHIGLQSTIERVETYSGQLMIDSKPGSGARVTVVIPKTMSQRS